MFNSECYSYWKIVICFINVKLLLEIDIIYVYEMYVEWIEMLRNLGKIEF